MNAVWKFFTTSLSFIGGNITITPLDILLKLIIPGAIVFIAYFVICMLIRRSINKSSRFKPETRTHLFRTIRLYLRIILIFSIVLLTSHLLGNTISKYLFSFWMVLNTPFINSGPVKISLVSLLLLIPIFIVSSWVSKKIKTLVDTTVLKPMLIMESVKFSISSLIRYGVLFLLLLFGLSLLGIDLTSLTVLLGVLGIGVGFGVQGIVANFFSGLIIFFQRPIKEGDRIVVYGIEGDIEKIQMLSTIINTGDNKTIIIPNSKLTGDAIYNFTYNNPQIVITNQVHISCNEDVERVAALLVETAKASSYIYTGKEPVVRLLGFQDSKMLLELRTWIHTAALKQEALSSLNYAIWKTFAENRILVPFAQPEPQLTPLPGKLIG